MLLAIDTSTDVSGVALRNEQGTLAEAVWQSGRRHAEQVLPMIDKLLEYVAAEPSHVQAVAVATGPGSWNGLRVGMSLAKGLATARNLPLVGVPTLDIVAYGLRMAHATLVPMVRLGRDRYGVAVYQTTPWQRLTPFQNLALDELPALSDAALFCGDVDVAAQQLLEARLGAVAHFATGSDNVRRPAVLADLGWQRWQQQDIDDLDTLEPIYGGHPVRTGQSPNVGIQSEAA